METAPEPGPRPTVDSSASYALGAESPAPNAERGVLRWLVFGNVMAILLVAVLSAFSLQASRTAFKQRALDATEDLAHGLQLSIAAEIGRVDMALQTVVLAYERNAKVGLIDPIGFNNLIEEQRSLVSAIDSLRVTDAAGHVQPGPGMPTEGLLDLGQHEFFLQGRAATTRRLIVSEPVPARGGEKWAIVLARRLSHPDGSFAGVAYADVATEHFQKMFAAVGIDGQSAISLRTAGLRLVARYAGQSGPVSGVGSANVSAQLKEALALNPNAGTYVALTALDGIERANAYQHVGEHPLIVIVGLATRDYLAPWRNDATLVGALGLLVALVLAGSSVVVYKTWRGELASNRALRLEAQRHRAFMLTASDGLHVLDRSGSVVELSDSFAAMLGHAREDLLGMHVSSWDVHLPADAVNEHMRSFHVGARREFATRHRRRDGSSFDVDVTSVGVRIEGRDLLYCSSRDATARRRDEQTLRASQAFLDRTGRVAGVGGWQVDLRTDEIIWSDQTCRIHDLEPGHSPTLKEAMSFFGPEVRLQLTEQRSASVLSGEPWDMELPLTTATGRSIRVRIFGEMEAEDGEPVRIIGALQDVTEMHRRKAELEREQALRSQIERHAHDLDGLLRERGEMLDVLAHEVRQPLNNASAALQSAASALAEVDEEVASFRLTRAQTVMGQVLARIDNTLAVATLLAHANPVVMEDTDIDTLISVVVADMPGTERRRIHIERVTTTRTASMDMSLMRLALRNLLSNALKFSPGGSPVSIRLTDSDEPLALVIEVIDAGPGVEDDLVPHLFVRGARGRAARRTAGHGLGLYIVRRVMELHGGGVDLVASGPQGTTMRLVIEQAPGR